MIDQADDDAGGALAGPAPPRASDYLQTLYKLIPAEITAGYLVIYSVLNPLGQMGESGYYITVAFLFFSIFALAALNYYAFPVLRGVTRKEIRLYVSATFFVWVLGTSVDFWAAFISEHFNQQIPNGVFLGVVILWAIASVMVLQRSGLRELDH